MNAALADAALSLVGTPFRLHGRDPVRGLDCVGLVAEAMRRAGHRPLPPEGYSLRTLSIAALLPSAAESGLVACGQNDADIVLARVNPVQAHVLVATPGGFVHAHAGLGQVVFLPAPLPWTAIGWWRLDQPRT